MKQCALCGSLVEDSAETCPHDGHASWIDAPRSGSEEESGDSSPAEPVVSEESELRPSPATNDAVPATSAPKKNKKK